MDGEEPTSDPTQSTCKTSGLLVTAVIDLTPAAPGSPLQAWLEIVNMSFPPAQPSRGGAQLSSKDKGLCQGFPTLKLELSCHLVASSSKSLKSPALTRQALFFYSKRFP